MKKAPLGGLPQPYQLCSRVWCMPPLLMGPWLECRRPILHLSTAAGGLEAGRLGVLCCAAGGLSTVLPPSWLRLFSPSELNQLISGGLDTGVDVDDMAM